MKIIQVNNDYKRNENKFINENKFKYNVEMSEVSTNKNGSIITNHREELSLNREEKHKPLQFILRPNLGHQS